MNVITRRPKMRLPKIHDSLTWGKRRKNHLSTEDTALVSAAISSLNKFSNDGSFIDDFIHPKNDSSGDPSNSSYENYEGRTEPKLVEVAPVETKEDAGTLKPTIGANQLAAKELQLRMKGKHEEAENLLKEAEKNNVGQDIGNQTSRLPIDGTTSRTVDQNVLDEIRNFKKCLMLMFGKKNKELVFLETVMGLAQQRRHCVVECIPLPQEMAKQAPMYFKKAIDEAEDEWSQHDVKKLIDTSEKGLGASIPKNFPYFHVEFGLNKIFVHVIERIQKQLWSQCDKRYTKFTC